MNYKTVSKSLTVLLASFCLPISTICAAGPPIVNGDILIGDIYYDCGTGASNCPSTYTSTTVSGVNGEQLFSEYINTKEKPIPVREGYEFVDWTITAIGSTVSRLPYNDKMLAVGDRMTDWESYKLNNIYGTKYNSPEDIDLRLKAIWKANTTNESSYPINLTIASTPINVTLPSSIELGFDGTDIEAVVPTNLTIQNNNSVGTVKVSEVKATLKDPTWTLNSDSSDEIYKNLPLDSKQLYLGFGKDASSMTPITAAGFDPGITVNPQSGGENTQAFSIQAKTGGSSTALNSNLINLELTLHYEKANEEVTILIDGKEMTVDKNFTFPEGEKVGMGPIQGYNRIKSSNAVMNLSLVDEDAEASFVPLAAVSTGMSDDIKMLISDLNNILKANDDLPFNCIRSTVEFVKSYLEYMSEFTDISPEQSTIVKHNVEAMLSYWRTNLAKYNFEWEPGSKVFSYIPSSIFYKNELYTLNDFVMAILNAFGMTPKLSFNDLKWKIVDGDRLVGEIEWPHYIDYRPGTSIEVNDGDAFYTIAGN